MYAALLFLHNTTRWLVLISLLLATLFGWIGWFRKSAWSQREERLGTTLATLFSLQFLLGVALYFLPNGIAQAAVRDFSLAMQVRELQFFGLEHPVQMIIALGLVHWGWTRSRKAQEDRRKFRWIIITYSLATVLVVTAIPWWRPFLRAFPF